MLEPRCASESFLDGGVSSPAWAHELEITKALLVSCEAAVKNSKFVLEFELVD